MKNQKNDTYLITITLVALVIYNLLFFWGKFAPDFLPNLIEPVFNGLRANKGFMTILEIIGVATVFIDLLGRYEVLGEKSVALRRVRLLVIGLLIMAFFFKLFINYLDSALM